MERCKRLFDIVFSLFALLLFLPLGIAIAIAIKSASSGPIFHACSRIGKNSKTIWCWKFRTMCVDADQKLADILRTDPVRKEEWERFFKLKDDPRINPVGRFLRKTSLDEIPQFLNVLMGDLSVVGPRPVTAEEIQKYYGAKAQKILSVRPGLTGIWQVSGRNLLSFDERVKLEERYIDERSLALDMQIICKTIPALLFAKGAF